MKKGDVVIIQANDETQLLGIDGKRGTVEWKDILGYVGVRIAGYIVPFALTQGEVAPAPVETEGRRA